jgi:hypothetical protein
VSRWFHRSILIVALITTGAACSSRRSRGRDETFPPVRLEIFNQNFYDATVYLIWRSDRRRLGVVGGNSRQSFTSQWYGPEFQIELQMLAGSRIRGDRVGVNPGEEFVVEIPSDPNRLRIYRR